MIAAVALCAALSGPTAGHRAVDYLREVMDRYHRTFDVYTDADAAGNHFVVKARMSSYDDIGNHAAGARTVPAMDEHSTRHPHSGNTCIEASFRSEISEGRFNWGAWYFLNGPGMNWGGAPDAGVDLHGATRLTFWVRGAKGGERVELFVAGVGWNPRDGSLQNDPATNKPFAHPDSSRKIGTGTIALSPQWTRYTIDLAHADLSYVLGGFGWAASASENGLRDVAFYIDDVRYELDAAATAARLNQPRFLVSYPDDAGVGRNAAHSYDNALALLAFLAAGDVPRARLIADAFVQAQAHDRFHPPDEASARIYGGSLRNTYQGGDLFAPHGAAVRLPAWWDRDAKTGEGRWLEDAYTVSLDAGNMAWVMLALLACHDAAAERGDGPYLEAAKKIGEWVIGNCSRDGSSGFTGGYNGWEPRPEKAEYRSTEHNIDLYAAFERLYRITGEARWHDRAEHARHFVMAMWNDREGAFRTGTTHTSAGDLPNTDVIPLDVQAWAVLSLGNALDETQRRRALHYAEEHMRMPDGGYDYSRRSCRNGGAVCDDREGVWYEGTAQMAAAYRAMGDLEKARRILAVLEKAQIPSSGAMEASDQKDGLRTGFFRDGIPIRYYKRPHVGATAWFIFAERGVNPYWLGTSLTPAASGTSHPPP